MWAGMGIGPLNIILLYVKKDTLRSKYQNNKHTLASSHEEIEVGLRHLCLFLFFRFRNLLSPGSYLVMLWSPILRRAEVQANLAPFLEPCPGSMGRAGVGVEREPGSQMAEQVQGH